LNPGFRGDVGLRRDLPTDFNKAMGFAVFIIGPAEAGPVGSTHPASLWKRKLKSG
jgi:hypothetical protein